MPFHADDYLTDVPGNVRQQMALVTLEIKLAVKWFLQKPWAAASRTFSAYLRRVATGVGSEEVVINRASSQTLDLLANC